MNKQSKKVELGVIEHAALENNRAYLLRTEITKSPLNNRICQHCGVKTSTVTPCFYYVFNISLSCNINIPSFIGNLWRVLLLGNHLKKKFVAKDRKQVPQIRTRQTQTSVPRASCHKQKNYAKAAFPNFPDAALSALGHQDIHA